MKYGTFIFLMWLIAIVFGLLLYKARESQSSPEDDCERSHGIVVRISGYHYHNLVDTLKKYEGFRSEPYDCAAGYNTIGYGHRNIEGLEFVCERQADSILRSDLNYAVVRAVSLTGLSGNKALACAGLIFSIGEGAFAKSRIRSEILSGRDVSHLWERYCHINGKPNARLKKKLSYLKDLYNE